MAKQMPIEQEFGRHVAPITENEARSAKGIGDSVVAAGLWRGLGFARRQAVLRG